MSTSQSLNINIKSGLSVRGQTSKVGKGSPNSKQNGSKVRTVSQNEDERD